jgi:tRNA G18 (ribose-2'-O)-methylase SpoU
MQIVVIAHNIRSLLNVGAILRTAEGFGVKQVYLTGYTPSPDRGLPHVRAKLAKQLHKTALGAENLVKFGDGGEIGALLSFLKEKDYQIIGLEQDPKAIKLPNYQPPKDKIALLLGEETAGLTPELRELCDQLIEIPMFGRKESFNVAVAAGIALYHLTTTKPAS